MISQPKQPDKDVVAVEEFVCKLQELGRNGGAYLTADELGYLVMLLRGYVGLVEKLNGNWRK